MTREKKGVISTFGAALRFGRQGGDRLSPGGTVKRSLSHVRNREIKQDRLSLSFSLFLSLSFLINLVPTSQIYFMSL